jgi:hypothetical protein
MLMICFPAEAKFIELVISYEARFMPASIGVVVPSAWKMFETSAATSLRLLSVTTMGPISVLAS